MSVIIIHSEHGDTVAVVARTKELDMMNISYTEIPQNYKLHEMIGGNDDLADNIRTILRNRPSLASIGLQKIDTTKGHVLE